jgi:rRNA processing protein Krr1/Pno1
MTSWVYLPLPRVATAVAITGAGALVAVHGELEKADVAKMAVVSMVMNLTSERLARRLRA